MLLGDTIAAISTAPGRGGIAVVRVSGSESFGIAERLAGIGERQSGFRVRKVYSRSDSRPLIPHSTDPRSSVPDTTSLIDECVILTFKGPHSYTGEDVIEFQCHGGAVTARRILEACFAEGARLAQRGEFTERAFLNGRIDYNQAESVLDLIDAKTTRAAAVAIEGLSGRRSAAWRGLYETALDISVRIEHALDIDEEELPPAFYDALDGSLEELRVSLRDAIARMGEGKLLRNGALVVLAGPPNVGKSSLMNALLEENRAIVSDIPGTTRDSIEEWMDLDGWPIRLVDTAGLHETTDAIETEGVKRSEDLIARADVVVWLNGEPVSAPQPSSSSTIAIHAKCDLARGEGLNVSSRTGEGLAALRAAIVKCLEEKANGLSGGAEMPSGVEALLAAQALLPRDCKDLVLSGNAMRQAAERLGTLVGAVYTEDFLDNLFSRFCIGK